MGSPRTAAARSRKTGFEAAAGGGLAEPWRGGVGGGMSAPVQGAAIRAAAARTIQAVRFDGVSLKAALPKALEGIADGRDRALCEAICFEAARWSLRYERLLDRLLERPLPPSARAIHAVLLAGLAQLDAMRLPDYAAISSSAEAVRLLKHPRHVGLVNAVLRRFVRERAQLDAAIGEDDGARHAHPAWLAETLRRDWGAQADALLAANNQAAPMWLRVNLGRIGRDEYREKLKGAGVDAADGALSPAALRIDHGLAPMRLPGWDEGLVSVQDLSAQLTAQAVDARDGLRVLDACAAPGGKTAHLRERTPGLAQLLALDVDAARLQRVRENLARLRLAADTRQADAAQPASWWDGRPFDRILLDAPCSGTGVIRRQPDIKLHRRAADVAGLAALQARLLDAAWPMLAAGGRLVYATCSVLKDENERQIDAFLARTPEAVPAPLAEAFGRVSGAGRQRLPGDDDGDGFFHAALEKRG
jgi:16S rRNA (cytosine967-C5)-methyltransferase